MDPDQARSLQHYVASAMQAEWRFDARSMRWEFREELDVTPAAKVGSSSPEVRQFLGILTRAIGARRIVEIGTSVGHGTIWLASALPEGGSIVTIEKDEARHRAALANFAASRATGITAICGDALAAMATLPRGSFDLVFIDGHKPEYDNYLRLAVQLCRPGAVIVADDMNWKPDELGDRFRAFARGLPAVAATESLDIGAGLEVIFLR